MGTSSSSELSEIEGMQISRVLPNSPAHVAGLLPFFDIILSIDTFALTMESQGFFLDYVKKNLIQSPMVLLVFNLRTRTKRDVVVSPNDDWGGVGLLGCAIQWISAEKALESTWHIVEIVRDSPAGRCPELLQQRDYLLGMQTIDNSSANNVKNREVDAVVVSLFNDESDFYERVSLWFSLRQTNSPHVTSHLIFLVYDSIGNSIKEVAVHMDDHSNGGLGMEVANGYLHILPTGALPSIKRFVVPIVSTSDRRDESGHVVVTPPSSKVAHEIPSQVPHEPTPTPTTALFHVTPLVSLSKGGFAPLSPSVMSPVQPPEPLPSPTTPSTQSSNLLLHNNTNTLSTILTGANNHNHHHRMQPYVLPPPVLLSSTTAPPLSALLHRSDQVTSSHVPSPLPFPNFVSSAPPKFPTFPVPPGTKM